MIAMDELLPCPFCGAPAKELDGRFTSCSSDNRQCPGDAIMAPIRAWNTRATPTPTAMDEREQLARIADEMRREHDAGDGHFSTAEVELIERMATRATPAPAEGQRDIAEECRDVYQHSQGAPQIVAAQPDCLAAPVEDAKIVRQLARLGQTQERSYAELLLMVDEAAACIRALVAERRGAVGLYKLQRECHRVMAVRAEAAEAERNRLAYRLAALEADYVTMKTALKRIAKPMKNSSPSGLRQSIAVDALSRLTTQESGCEHIWDGSPRYDGYAWRNSCSRCGCGQPVTKESGQ